MRILLIYATNPKWIKRLQGQENTTANMLTKNGFKINTRQQIQANILYIVELN